MMSAGINIHRAASGCMLVGQAIDVPKIRRVAMLTHPKLTIYIRPTYDPLRACPQDTTSIRCLACLSTWELGTWLCLKCREPLNFQAINDQDSICHESRQARDDELWRRCCINRTDFERLRTEHGSAIAGIMLIPVEREGPSLVGGGALPQGGPQVPVKAPPAPYLPKRPPPPAPKQAPRMTTPPPTLRAAVPKPQAPLPLAGPKAPPPTGGQRPHHRIWANAQV